MNIHNILLVLLVVVVIAYVSMTLCYGKILAELDSKSVVEASSKSSFEGDAVIVVHKQHLKILELKSELSDHTEQGGH